MKKFILLSLFLSSTAMAVPRGIYLAAPKKIEVVGEKLRLMFYLNCANENPDEWTGQLIAVSDDEGDYVVGLGVALSKDMCLPGPKKKFVFEYTLAQAGLTKAALTDGTTFEPLNIAR